MSAHGNVSLLVMGVIACGGSGPAEPPVPPTVDTSGGYTLVLRGGVFDDGTRRGLSLLATLRDAAGKGPQTPWSLSVRAPSGLDVADVDYFDSSSGSFMAWWWGAVAPETGKFRVSAIGPDGASIDLPFEVLDRNGIASARPSLATDARSLVWEAAPGASAYVCQVTASGSTLITTAPSTNRACDVSTLPEGAYVASVLSLSVDPAELSANAAQRPVLPAFDVAAGVLGFSRSSTSPSVQLRAAGGTLNFGRLNPGLAFWVSVANADGTPPTAEWTVSVTGPGISSSNPLVATYAASRPQLTFWSYDLTARAGTYVVIASSGATQLLTEVPVGDAASALPIATGIIATPKPSGAADVAWSAVAGASSYRIAVWPSGPGATAPVVESWVRDPRAMLPTGTFTAGKSYDVYVMAAGVDMTGTPSMPASVALSENSYQPVTFSAP